MAKKRIKKSIVYPLILAMYAVAMSLYFGPRLLEEGLTVKFWVSVIVEIVVIICLFFALRRKERLASEWDN